MKIDINNLDHKEQLFTEILKNACEHLTEKTSDALVYKVVDKEVEVTTAEGYTLKVHDDEVLELLDEYVNDIELLRNEILTKDWQ